MSSANDTGLSERGRGGGFARHLDDVRARLLWQKYWYNLVSAVVIILMGWFVRHQFQYPLAATGGFVLAALFLANAAHCLARKNAPDVDIVATSEQIIALGILSLICGLGFALLAFLSASEAEAFQWSTIQRTIGLFGEGLAAAAIAPTIGMILRQIHARPLPAGEADTDPPFGFGAAAKLTRELNEATRAAAELKGAIRDGATALTAVFGDLDTSIRHARNGFEAEIIAMRDALARAAGTLSGAAEGAAGGIAAAAQGLTAAVARMEGQIGAAGSAIMASAGKAADSVEEAGRGLQFAVGSVETQLGNAGHNLSERLTQVGRELTPPTEKLNAVVDGFERSIQVCELTLQRLDHLPVRAAAAVQTIEDRFTQLADRIREATDRLDAFNQLVADVRQFVGDAESPP